MRSLGQGAALALLNWTPAFAALKPLGAPRPFDYAAFKAAYRDAGGQGAWMVNNGYDAATAREAVASGRADMVAFGRAFISTPDLVERLRRGADFNAWDSKTFYGGGEKGYTDYPTLAQI